jgi:hypothetical protein
MVSFREIIDEVRGSTRKGVWHSTRSLADRFKTAHEEILNHFMGAEDDPYFVDRHRWVTRSDMLLLRIGHEHGLRSLSERAIKELKENISRTKETPDEKRIINTEERPELSKEKAPPPDMGQIVEIIKEVVAALTKQKGSPPTKEEIAQVLGVSPKDLESLLTVFEQSGIKLL